MQKVVNNSHSIQFIGARNDNAKTANTETEKSAAAASSTNDDGNTQAVKSNNAISMSKNMSSMANIKVEKDLPKAMIKPNVLTHVIEGLLIKEADEPFPVTRQRYTDKETDDEPPSEYIYKNKDKTTFFAMH